MSHGSVFVVYYKCGETKMNLPFSPLKTRSRVLARDSGQL